MLLEPHAGTILWTLITFALVLFILRGTVWKPLLTALDEREASIRGALEGADKARDDAEAVLAEHRSKLEQAEDDARAIVSESRGAAEKVHQEILAEARAHAEQTVEQARRSIESEKLAAIAELRREVADLAVQAAGALLDANLDDEGNRKLVDDLIDKIPQSSAPNN
jgi:F-type H+-transporting ATPase subunit b